MSNMKGLKLRLIQYRIKGKNTDNKTSYIYDLSEINSNSFFISEIMLLFLFKKG